jgi:hypothetical protein
MRTISRRRHNVDPKLNTSVRLPVDAIQEFGLRARRGRFHPARPVNVILKTGTNETRAHTASSAVDRRPEPLRSLPGRRRNISAIRWLLPRRADCPRSIPFFLRRPRRHPANEDARIATVPTAAVGAVPDLSAIRSAADCGCIPAESPRAAAISCRRQPSAIASIR